MAFPKIRFVYGLRPLLFSRGLFSIALVFYFDVVALFKCCSGVFLYSGHCLYDPVLFKRGGDAVTVVVEGHFIGHCFDFF